MYNGVQQSGVVTPGHLAAWSANGVVQDGGPILGAQYVLGALFSANFNATTDQSIVLLPAITAFQLTGIVVTNASISLTTAAGGFYPAASKGGSAIVSSAQAYSALTTVDKLLNATLTTFGTTTRFSADNLSYLPNVTANANGLAVYLSLTTAQGALATADVYIIGIDLSPP